MGKYSKLADIIIKNVGGKENIIDLRHCATRLRFQLKDESIANDEVLKNTEGIIAVMKSMGEYMTVIGEPVPYVYNEVCEKIGKSTATATETKDKPKEKLFNRILNTLMAGLGPTLNMACACGIIKGLTAILVVMNVITIDSGIYTFMDGIGSALFFFLPMILGYNVAKKVGIDPMLGFLIGAIMCYPTLNGVDINLFGYVINATYTGTFLPVIITVALAAPIDKFLRKHISELVSNFLVPAIVVFTVVPIGFIMIGPAANMLGTAVSEGFNIALGFNKWIAGPLFAGLWQVLILMGIHGTVLIIPFMDLMQGIPSQVLALTFVCTFAQIGVVLAIYLKTKDKKLKSIALPAFISGIFGITEPAVYGVTLPRIKMFVVSCIGSAVAGLCVIMFNAIEYYYSGLGIFGLLGFMNPENPSLIPVLISISVAFILSFVLGYILYKDDSSATKESKEEKSEIQSVYSPIQGKVLPLSEAKDSAFSSEVLGKGIVIYPDNGEVVAPFDGTVASLFPTKHAIGIVSQSGCEVLIHIGYNTVHFEGKHFESHVKQGDFVHKGDKLVSFDKEAIEKAGFSVETPVIVTNVNEYVDIVATDKERIMQGEEAISVL